MQLIREKDRLIQYICVAKQNREYKKTVLRDPSETS